MASLIQASGRGGLKSMLSRYSVPASVGASNITLASTAGSTAELATSGATTPATLTTTQAANAPKASTVAVNGSLAGRVGQLAPALAMRVGGMNVERPGSFSLAGNVASPVAGRLAVAPSRGDVGQSTLPSGDPGMAPGELPIATMPALPGKGFDSVGAFPVMDEATQKVFQKLQDDSQAVFDKSEVTPKLEAAVRKDFEKIQAASTTDPDEAKVNDLMDLVQGLEGTLTTDEQRQQIKDAFTAVVKSQGVSDQSLIDQTISDIQAVNKARNITADDLATLAADRKAIDDLLASNTSDSAAIAMPAPDLLTSHGPLGGLGGI